jgi:hypothetical protein
VNKILGMLKSELLTKLNLLATAVLLWIVSQPNAPTDKVLEFVPADYHSLVTTIAPILWAILVQFAIGQLKRKTAEKTEEKVLNELTASN